MSITLTKGTETATVVVNVTFEKSFNEKMLDDILETDIEFTAPPTMYIAPDNGDASIASLSSAIALSSTITGVTLSVDDSTYNKIDEHSATIEATLTAGGLSRKIQVPMTIGSV